MTVEPGLGLGIGARVGARTVEPGLGLGQSSQGWG